METRLESDSVGITRRGRFYKLLILLTYMTREPSVREGGIANSNSDGGLLVVTTDIVVSRTGEKQDACWIYVMDRRKEVPALS
jgi:hypothetical protein